MGLTSLEVVQRWWSDAVTALGLDNRNRSCRRPAPRTQHLLIFDLARTSRAGCAFLESSPFQGCAMFLDSPFRFFPIFSVFHLFLQKSPELYCPDIRAPLPEVDIIPSFQAIFKSRMNGGGYCINRVFSAFRSVSWCRSPYASQSRIREIVLRGVACVGRAPPSQQLKRAR